jgi:hypothetical protein
MLDRIYRTWKKEVEKMEDEPKGPIWCGRVGWEDFECGVAYWDKEEGVTANDCEICSRLQVALALADIAKALNKKA